MNNLPISKRYILRFQKKKNSLNYLIIFNIVTLQRSSYSTWLKASQIYKLLSKVNRRAIDWSQNVGFTLSFQLINHNFSWNLDMCLPKVIKVMS